MTEKELNDRILELEGQLARVGEQRDRAESDAAQESSRTERLRLIIAGHEIVQARMRAADDLVREAVDADQTDAAWWQRARALVAQGRRG